ncbi:hypothetical protein Leryth_016300, partial [Lithospermum erythrorhizon]
MLIAVLFQMEVISIDFEISSSMFMWTANILMKKVAISWQWLKGMPLMTVKTNILVLKDPISLHLLNIQ